MRDLYPEELELMLDVLRAESDPPRPDVPEDYVDRLPFVEEG